MWLTQCYPGTDHPFFPPLATDSNGKKEWLSVTTNYKAIKDAFGDKEDLVEGVLGGNAVKLLRLSM